MSCIKIRKLDSEMEDALRTISFGERLRKNVSNKRTG